MRIQEMVGKSAHRWLPEAIIGGDQARGGVSQMKKK